MASFVNNRLCLLKQHYEVSHLEMGTGERSVTVYVIDPVLQSSAPVYVSGGPREGWGFFGARKSPSSVWHDAFIRTWKLYGQYHCTNIKSKVYQKILIVIIYSTSCCSKPLLLVEHKEYFTMKVNGIQTNKQNIIVGVLQKVLEWHEGEWMRSF